MNISMLYKALTVHFEQYKDAKNAQAMKQYMRNKFDFLGLKSAARQRLGKQFWNSKDIDFALLLPSLVPLLFQSPYRELHYHALDLIWWKHKQLDAKKWLPMLETLLQTKSWWDSVDYIAPKIAGTFLKDQPKLIAKYPDQWINSPDFWVQRGAILFQLKYKQSTDAARVWQYIRKVKTSKEFFIQKACGWALREYSKTNPQQVVDFIKKESLSALTKREGLKWLKDKKLLSK